ncbi:MAG: cytochrome P450 [Myxococcales bacterium]|nr:cytochrome P450 [Myxococcales bacterium]
MSTFNFVAEPGAPARRGLVTRAREAVASMAVIPRMRRAPLAVLEERVRQRGDMATLDVGPYRYYLVHHPEAIRVVLETRADRYPRRTKIWSEIRRVVGDGIVISEGARWRSQRRRLRPGLSRAALAGYRARVVSRTDDWIDGIAGLRSVDMSSELSALALQVFADLLLGLPLTLEEARATARVMESISRELMARVTNPLAPPWSLPTPSNRRLRAGIARVDRLIDRALTLDARARVGPAAIDGLLPGDAAEGPPLPRDWIRDEAMTMLFAAHETTSITLAWTTYLLAAHPRWQTVVAGELAARASGDPSSARAELPALARVVDESMRLYPAAWFLERRSLDDDVLCGRRIPRGAVVVVSPYLLHRDPRWWPQPSVFDPARFERPPNKLIYLPFGAGPRACSGRHAATMVMHAVLRRLIARLELAVCSFEAPRPRPGVNLYPDRAVELAITPRAR